MKRLACSLCLLQAISWYAAAERAEKVDSSEEHPNAYYKLESTIVGDKEQPAVSYFIPWKGTSTPDKLQWNLNVKHDQTLDLIDRDVIVRSMNIYDEMQLEAATSPASE